MKFFTSLLLGVSLTNFFVSALPFSGPSSSSESNIAEREDTQLLARTDRDDFAKHGTYNKKDVVKFVKKIPLAKLSGFGDSTRVIHSVDENNKPARNREEKQDSGFRLDNQGKTCPGEDYHNLQVQINGQVKGKSTVGGILVKGDMSPKRVRAKLIHAVMHPDKVRQYAKGEPKRKAQAGHSPDKSRKRPKNGNKGPKGGNKPKSGKAKHK